MTIRFLLGLLGTLPFVAACGNGGGGGGDMGVPSSSVVVNELFPHGTSAADPDWAELRNNGKTTVDLTGYKVRDGSLANLFKLPDGTKLDAGGYLVVYCDDLADGGVSGGIHVPWKLSAKKGDEFHLVTPSGADADATVFTADLPLAKSWGRLPDGTGMFFTTTPTKGVANY